MATENPMINPVVVLREEFDDWAVLFNPDTADAMGINPVGVEVWKMMDGSRDITSIVDEIKNMFDDVPEDEVVEEISVFIKELGDRGFTAMEAGAGE